MGWFWLTSYGNAGFRRLPLPVLVQNGNCAGLWAFLHTFVDILWRFVVFCELFLWCCVDVFGEN